MQQIEPAQPALEAEGNRDANPGPVVERDQDALLIMDKQVNEESEEKFKNLFYEVHPAVDNRHANQICTYRAEKGSLRSERKCLNLASIDLVSDRTQTKIFSGV